MVMKVDIEGVDFEKSNIIFVDGLTLEKVKMKYNWLLNAKVKDAIVGENDRGIVWYFGEWFCGEWLDGTWYSGDWYDGVWKNGVWYSYLLNKFDVLNQVFYIKQHGHSYSHFHNGVWLNGVFDDGIFGIDSNENWDGYELYTDGDYPTFRTQSLVVGGSIQYEYKSLATWMNGIFKDGIFYDAIWNIGDHVNGLMINSKWISGNWYNGTFDGDVWYNGNWYNGQFIKGDWYNGVFTQINTDVISRFGNTILDTENVAICRWFNGVWKNGEWFSGYLEDSDGNPIDSEKNYLSIWENGTWENGTWYGGQFENGIWENGIWKNGIFGYLKSTEWIEPMLVNVPDFYTLNWSGNTVMPSNVNDSNLVVASNTSNTYYELEYYNQSYQSENQIHIEDPNQSPRNSRGLFCDNIFNQNSFGIIFVASNYVDFNFEIFGDDILAQGIDNFYNFPIIDNFTVIVEYDNGVIVELTSDDVSILPYTSLNDIMFRLVGVPDYTTTIVSLNFTIKRKVILPSSNGIDCTHWEYNNTTLSEIYFNINSVLTTQIIEVISGGPFPRTQILNYMTYLIDCNYIEYFSVGDTIEIVGETLTIKTIVKIDNNTIKIITTKDNISRILPHFFNENLILKTKHFLKLNGTSTHGFVVGDYIYIEQDKDYVNSSYNGVAQIINIFNGINSTDNSYIVVSKKYMENSSDSGKVVKYMGLFFDRDTTLISSQIIFQDFDFKLPETLTSTIVGFNVKFNCDVNNDKSGNEEAYKINKIFLPYKNLYLNDSSSSLGYDMTYDTYEYTDVYGSSVFGDLITPNKIEKTINSTITENSSYNLGGFNDMWGLSSNDASLENYYPSSEGFNPNFYNPKNLSIQNNKLRISLSFSMTNIISQRFYLKDVKIRLFYNNDIDTPKWYNGIFKRGTWYNGDFYQGDFLSGLWFKGNFYDGNMGSGYR